MVLRRHVCIVFLPNPPTTIPKLPSRLSHVWLTFLKRCNWLVRHARIQQARDDKGPYFCINQNKNIDDIVILMRVSKPSLLLIMTAQTKKDYNRRPKL